MRLARFVRRLLRALSGDSDDDRSSRVCGGHRHLVFRRRLLTHAHSTRPAHASTSHSTLIMSTAAAAIENEWVDGRSAIDIFVKKNNGVGYTYDDLILMPGTSSLALRSCVLLPDLMRATCCCQTRRHAARLASTQRSLAATHRHIDGRQSNGCVTPSLVTAMTLMLKLSEMRRSCQDGQSGGLAICQSVSLSVSVCASASAKSLPVDRSSCFCATAC